MTCNAQARLSSWSLPVIEELGRVGADRGMQPPGLFEEQPLVRRNGLFAAENVIERRHIGALGMAALHRLIELLRIANQHDGLRRLRHREHVGERHLRGFVDEKHVDGFERVRPRP